MPGLLRAVARTAVISGTATAVGNNVSRRQANRWAEQGGYYKNGPDPSYVETLQQGTQPPAQQQVAAPAAAPTQSLPAPDPIQQLTKLGELRAAGVLTDEEFAAQKAKILNG